MQNEWTATVETSKTKTATNCKKFTQLSNNDDNNKCIIEIAHSAKTAVPKLSPLIDNR